MAKKTKTTRPATENVEVKPEVVIAEETTTVPEAVDTKPKTVKKSKSKKAETAVADVVVEEVPVVSTTEETVVEDAAPKKSKKSKKAATTPVVEETVSTEETKVEDEVSVEDEVVVDEVAVVPEEKTGEKRKRRVVSKDKLLEEMEELQKELVPILETSHKKVLKLFKVVVSDTFRLLKIKTAQKKQKDATNSGFMRPVRPSEALQKFLDTLGLKPEPLTRAHLTTILCKYIKEKDLQNPEDRREIFPDGELRELFNITDADTEPLTYYSLQKRIQPHVMRIEDVSVPTTVVA